MKEISLEELIYSETDKRLQEMAAPDYRFPEKIDRRDVIGICAALPAEVRSKLIGEVIGAGLGAEFQS